MEIVLSRFISFANKHPVFRHIFISKSSNILSWGQVSAAGRSVHYPQTFPSCTLSAMCAQQFCFVLLKNARMALENMCSLRQHVLLCNLLSTFLRWCYHRLVNDLHQGRWYNFDFGLEHKGLDFHFFKKKKVVKYWFDWPRYVMVHPRSWEMSTPPLDKVNTRLL